MKNKLKRKSAQAYWVFQEDMKKFHIGAYASSAAFFTFLSLIPMLLLLFSIMPYTPVTKDMLIHFIDILIPDTVSVFAVDIVNEMYHKSGAYLSLTILFTLWSAGKGTLALIQALNTLHEVEDQRNYVILRLKACFYTLIMLLSVVGSLITVMFGNRIKLWITKPFPNLIYFFETILHIRILIILVFLTFFIGMVYTWLPENRFKTEEVKKNGKPVFKRKRRSFRHEFPGAFTAALVWYFSSWFFSKYINRFFGFSTYGSLTTVIVIMFWLYLCFYVILLGAYMNLKTEQVNELLKRVLQKRKTIKANDTWMK